MSETRLSLIGQHFEQRYVATGKIVGCDIAVVRGGHLAYRTTLGYRDRERELPVTDDTVWRIYSMSKPITSVALMQLYERGEFLLDDPVTRFIPQWRDLVVATPEGGSAQLDRPMTVADLMMHMSGLAGAVVPANPIDFRFNEALREKRKGLTLEAMCSLLAEFPLKFQPGTHWNYGLSTDICGRLVEIISGQRLDDYLTAHLFGPLAMTDAGFSIGSNQVDRFAAAYRYRAGETPLLFDDPTTSSYLRERSYLSGAGGLVATTGDYLRFAQMLVNGGELDDARIIGRKTLDLMTRNHLPGGGELKDFAVGGFGEAGFEGVGFGLGFAIGLGPERTKMAGSVGEFYWGGMASTAFWVDPSEELAVVFMTQLLPSVAYPFRSQLRALVYQALE